MQVRRGTFVKVLLSSLISIGAALAAPAAWAYIISSPSGNDAILFEAVLNRCVGKSVGDAKREDLAVWESTFGYAKKGKHCYLVTGKSADSKVGGNVECAGKVLSLVKYFNSRSDCLVFKKSWRATVAQRKTRKK